MGELILADFRGKTWTSEKRRIAEAEKMGIDVANRAFPSCFGFDPDPIATYHAPEKDPA